MKHRASIPSRQHAPARFRSAQRLGRPVIEEMLRTARRRRTSLVSVSMQPNGLDFSRMAVIVPKRLLARAVDRNRSKRLMREWFRLHQGRFAGNDLLIRLTGRPETPDVIPGQLVELMPGLLEQIRARMRDLPSPR